MFTSTCWQLEACDINQFDLLQEIFLQSDPTGLDAGAQAVWQIYISLSFAEHATSVSFRIPHDFEIHESTKPSDT